MAELPSCELQLFQQIRKNSAVSFSHSWMQNVGRCKWQSAVACNLVLMYKVLQALEDLTCALSSLPIVVETADMYFAFF